MATTWSSLQLTADGKHLLFVETNKQEVLIPKDLSNVQFNIAEGTLSANYAGVISFEIAADSFGKGSIGEVYEYLMTFYPMLS